VRTETRGEFLGDFREFLQLDRCDHPALRRAVPRQRHRYLGEQAMLVAHEGAPAAAVDPAAQFQRGKRLRRGFGLGRQPSDRPG
jgi:hypothetical protein